MLKFRAHLIEIGETPTYYLLLPKMTEGQLSVVSERLSSAGYTIRTGRLLKGEKSESRIAVNREGICRSNFDPSDLLLPMIPSLLKFQKQVVTGSELLEMYLSARRSGNSLTLRLSTRLETSKEWAQLRGAAVCALSPDEHLVFSTLLRRTGGTVSIITDYPTENSRVTRPGGKQYYVSSIPSTEAAENLRVVGERGARNVYLPRSGMLRIIAPTLKRLGQITSTLPDLGEWCFFTPG